MEVIVIVREVTRRVCKSVEQNADVQEIEKSAVVSAVQ